MFFASLGAGAAALAGNWAGGGAAFAAAILRGGRSLVSVSVVSPLLVSIIAEPGSESSESIIAVLL